MEFIKVEGHDGLVRDPNTKAIINTNRDDYEKYKKQRETKLKEKEKVERIESDVNSIKNDLDEIKSILRSLIDENKSRWNTIRRYF